MSNLRSLLLKPLTVGFFLLVLSTVVLAQHYQQTNLVSNVPGRASVTDPNLVNSWGLVHGSGTPWWVADNGAGVSTLYNGSGQIVPLVVAIPAASGKGTGAPTGVVFNGNPHEFLLAPETPALFIFATEDGTISAAATLSFMILASTVWEFPRNFSMTISFPQALLRSTFKELDLIFTSPMPSKMRQNTMTYTAQVWAMSTFSALEATCYSGFNTEYGLTVRGVLH